MTIIVLHVRFDLSLSSSSFRIKKGLINWCSGRWFWGGARGGRGGGGQGTLPLHGAYICYKGHVPPRFAPHAHLADGRPVVPIGKTTRHALASSRPFGPKRESRRPHFRSQMPLTALAVRHEDARLRCACVRFLTPAWPDCSMTARGRHLREEITLSVAGLSLCPAATRVGKGQERRAGSVYKFEIRGPYSQSSISMA